MRGLRVVVALESSGPGGAENMVLQLAQELRRSGDDAVIATLRPGWMTERAASAGIPVWVMPQRPGLDPLWAPRFAARLRRERIDVLHSHEFAMNVYGGAAAWLARIPSIATLHGRSYATEARRRLLAYRALRLAGMRLVAVSHDLAAFLAPRFAMALPEFDVVYNGITVRPPPSASERDRARCALRKELGAPPGAELVLAVGNLYPVKDHATLLRAVALRPGLHTAIAGRGGEEATLRALAGTLGIADRLHLLGLRDDVPQLLDAADVFVQSSLSEGLPLAVLEAMAAGLPVVATRVGGVHEAVSDGETGALLPPGDPKAMAAALDRLLDDPALRSRYGESGRRLASERFSVATMASCYRRLYVETPR